MATVLRILVFVSSGWLVFAIMIFGSRLRGNPFGEPPIPRFAFLLAKLGVGISFLLLLGRAALAPPSLPGWATFAVVCLLVGGCCIGTAAFSALGASLRVGLPQERTALVTSGIYRFSRNPIYLGLYLFLAASLVYSFSWLNVGAVLTGVVLHHRIILAEERFLAERFGEYEAYRNNVRRYC